MLLSFSLCVCVWGNQGRNPDPAGTLIPSLTLALGQVTPSHQLTVVEQPTRFTGPKSKRKTEFSVPKCIRLIDKTRRRGTVGALVVADQRVTMGSSARTRCKLAMMGAASIKG